MPGTHRLVNDGFTTQDYSGPDPYIHFNLLSLNVSGGSDAITALSVDDSGNVDGADQNDFHIHIDVGSGEDSFYGTAITNVNADFPVEDDRVFAFSWGTAPDYQILISYPPGAQAGEFDLTFRALSGSASGEFQLGDISYDSSGQDMPDYFRFRSTPGGEMTVEYVGSDDDETFNGTSGDEILSGNDGNDMLNGGGGNDTLNGGNDNDTLNGGSGNDILDGGDGDDTLNGGGGNDTVSYADASAGVTVSLAIAAQQITGGAGKDTLTGIANLVGSAQNDTLTGDSHDNVLEGGAGNDVLNGGGGNDTASYAGAGAGVTVNLSTGGPQNTFGAGTDTLTGFENLIGSAYSDTLTGDVGDNVLEGGAGNDALNGGGGNDTASYAGAGAGVTVSLAIAGQQNTFGAGSDTLTGFENLIGSSYDDTLTGDSHDNVLAGGDGNDTLNGGAGLDTASYAGTTAGVVVNLAAGTEQNTATGGSGALTGMENVTGSAFDDMLTGDGGGNALAGGNGNDTLKGSGGNDVLDGGAGSNTAIFTGAWSDYTISSFGASWTVADNRGSAPDGADVLANVENIQFSNGTFAVQVAAPVLSLVSVSSAGAAANNYNFAPSISADGNRVAFESTASTLVSGDTNNTADIFLRDLALGTTQRLSVDAGGAQVTGNSAQPSISADGHHVAFESSAPNLVLGDNNGAYDVFVRDVDLQATRLVSVSLAGGAGNDASDEPSISSDGRYVAFRSDANNLVASDNNFTSDVFVRDLQLNTTQLVSVSSAGTAGNNYSDRPSISADGRHVAFESEASNLVATNLNGNTNIFVRNLDTNTTQLVSVSSTGGAADAYSNSPSISADGRYVAFDSGATNLVTGDTNGTSDVFVRDLQLNTTKLVSVSTTGQASNGSSYSASISADGRYVTFESDASNLVPDDTDGTDDVFVRDLLLGTTQRVSIGSGGEPDSFSATPSISNNGAIAFQSYATNLVNGDANGISDIFVSSLQQSNATLSGGAGRDLLVGGGGADTLSGGLGDDVLSGGAGNDYLDGGAGNDTASYADAGAGVNVNLSIAGAQNTGGAGTDTLVGIENLTGSAYGDTLKGDGVHSASLAGGAGNDSLQGGAANDYFDGGAGLDMVTYANTAAGVNVDLSMAGPQNTGGAGTDQLANIEYLAGSAFNDTLKGDGVHSTYLAGGAGNDTLQGGAAADYLDGGAGSDIVSYANAMAGVSVDLSIAGPQNTGGAGADQLVNMEGLVGSSYADTLAGDGVHNATLSGGAGNDILLSGAGNDIIDGGAGYDVASYANAAAGVNVDLSLPGPQNTGGAGTDTLIGIEYVVGSAYGDTLKSDGMHSAFIAGGAGNDSLQGGRTDDYFDGGPGFDIVTYGNATAGVNVDLSIAGPQNTGGAGSDILANIEYLAGSAFNDTLKGDGVHNVYLAGGAGNDTLQGGASTDYLVGGTGNDTMTGGGDSDTFAFTTGDGLDTVTDFSATGPASDILSLAGYGILTFTALQPLIAQSGADTVITFNAQNRVTLLGVQAAQLTAGNFQFH